jgi:GTP pyrophosphokinase
MRTLSYMSREKQIQKATETQDVYAKLAKALGMWEIKIELNDLSYKYLDPSAFTRSKKEISTDKRVADSTKSVTSILNKLLLRNSIKARIYPSVNGCWAIEQKKDKNLDKGISAKRNIKNINDVVSFRVLVKDVDSCYKTLGIIEQYYGDQVDEERFDNYLLKPRINGYSALQTTVITAFGAIEIAITTEDRENFNRLGIVSLLTKRNHANLKKYVLKVIFNQNGEIMFLPKKATGLDALYKNPHTAASAMAIYVNGKKQPLSKILPNGSVILGIYSKKVQRAPNKKLLKYALEDTKRLMLAQINLQEKQKLIATGRKKMRKILTPRGILTLSDIDDLAWQLVYLCNAESIYDLLLKFGKGSIKKNQINDYLNKLGLMKKEKTYSTVFLKGKKYKIWKTLHPKTFSKRFNARK